MRAQGDRLRAGAVRCAPQTGGAIVSVALFDQLESLLEDVVIVPQIHERIERGEGDASMTQIAEGLGLDPADFE